MTTASKSSFEISNLHGKFWDFPLKARYWIVETSVVSDPRF